MNLQLRDVWYDKKYNEKADVLMIQLVQHPPRDTPEQALMRAILDDAVLCLKRDLGNCQTTRGARLLEEGLLWLSDGRADYPTSFASICRCLDIDPGWMREGILNSLALSLTDKKSFLWRRRCYSVSSRSRDPDKAHGSAWKERRKAR